MASETTLFESAQAIFCAAADYLGAKKSDLILDSKKYPTFTEFKEDNLSLLNKALTRVKVDVDVKEVYKFLEKKDSWYKSSLLIAVKIVKDLHQIDPQFHINAPKFNDGNMYYLRNRGGVMETIQKLFKIANASLVTKMLKEEVPGVFGFADINKWSPADIYFASPVAVEELKKLLGKALAKPQSFDFNALNKTIKDLIDKGAMLPLSLKKVAGTVQLKAVNFSETIEDKLLSSVKFTKISEWKPFKRLGKTESLSFKQIKKGKSTETRDIKVYFTAANGGGHIKFRQDPSGPSWKGEYMPVGGAAKGGGISSDKQMAKIWASVDRTAASAFQKAYTAGTNKFKDKKAKIQKDKEKLRKDKFKNTTAYDHYLAIYSSEEVINKTMPIIKNWFKKNTDERDKLVRLIFQVVTSRSPLSARFVIAK
tara:strand:- start:276 stop:1547 length:1272 start_codon:yes stop_codon:yes gene_type:complete